MAMENTTLRIYSSLIEAEGARAYLEAHGIAAQLPDRHAVTLQPHLMEVLGGIRLEVPAKDQMQAEELLSAVERRSHLTSVDQEEGFLERQMEQKKRAQVRHLARFVILVFAIYYLIKIIGDRI